MMYFKKLINRKVMMAAVCGLVLGLTSSAAFSAAGYDLKMLSSDNPERPLPLHIWYPAEADGQVDFVGKNAVFVGAEVHYDATPLAGTHPVVVLSHGSGGNAANLGWLAASLSERGVIVIATNHPGTTSRDSSPQKTVKVWQRTQDVSRIVDYIEQGGLAALSPNVERIGVMGFSLGGHTALSVVGARVNKGKYIGYCQQPNDAHDCAWLKRGGADLNAIDAVKYEQSNLDARIKVAVSIDPALAQAYVDESLQAIAIPVQVINLGAVGEVPSGIDGAALVQQIKDVQHVNIAGSTHFSFLGVCSALGVKIIANEGEEPICTEVGGRERGDIHDEIKVLIGEFLEQHL